MGFFYICHLSFSCAGQHKARLLQTRTVDLLLVACLFVLRPIYKNGPRQGIVPAAQMLNNHRSFLGAMCSNLCNNLAANRSPGSHVYENSHFCVQRYFLKNKNPVSESIHIKVYKNIKFNLDRCRFSETRPTRRICRSQHDQININQKLYIGFNLRQGIHRTVTHEGPGFSAPSG